MKYEIKSLEEAVEDLLNLDKSVRAKVMKTIKKLGDYPYLRKPLKGRLKGFYKVYVDKKI